MTTIHFWSGPRSLSTSLLYSFGNREDVVAFDEPLYAHWLRLTGAERPYRDAVLASQDNDGESVLRRLAAPAPGRLHVAKHMSKQSLGLPNDLLLLGRHFLIVRHPAAIVRSFSAVLDPSLDETGLPSLVALYSLLHSAGRPPVVICAEDLQTAPEETLRRLCSSLGIAFSPKQLSWRSGPKPFDGVWASHWYSSVHASTCFEPANAFAQARPLTTAQASLVDDCMPFYTFLRAKATGGRPELARTPSAPPPLLPLGEAPLGIASSGAPHVAATHACLPDERNATVLVGIRDGVTGRFELHSRPHAKVSVLDGGFILGDGVWEGIRLHKGVLLFADKHLQRLWEGCAAIDLQLGVSRETLLRMIYAVVDANGMSDAVHVRLMCTRGLKPTPFQDPRTTIGLPTIVVLAEYKSPPPPRGGLRLATVHVRRGAPDVQDPGLNSHSKANCIAACIAGAKAGADEALMLDKDGFVATCNSTNFLIVRKGELWAPLPTHHMPGITKATVLDCARAAGIPVRELQFSLAAVYGADEAFVTGTFAGLLPVASVDGRLIGACSAPGTQPLLPRLTALYKAAVEECAQKGR